jgi:hypothetical protein
MKYTEDRIIPRQALPEHPGPWTGKQHVYQLEKLKGEDWFMVEEIIYDKNGKKVPAEYFEMVSGLFGTREWLGLDDDEPILYVKNTNKFY